MKYTTVSLHELHDKLFSAPPAEDLALARLDEQCFDAVHTIDYRTAYDLVVSMDLPFLDELAHRPVDFGTWLVRMTDPQLVEEQPLTMRRALQCYYGYHQVEGEFALESTDSTYKWVRHLITQAN